MNGKVYLIGAGPGDAGLITRKGYRKLKEADVVVYDRLANPELMEDLSDDVKYIYVGKASKNHAKTQDEINEIIYQEAKAGNIVARLKGGDPYVFGRGGEEGEYLYDRGIEFEEIPGITSAIGGLAYSGIPITHRGIATSFHVITGHLKDEEDELNFEALAKLDGTLVFLMGISNLEKISSELLKYGKNKDTKAALINWGTTTRQKVVEGTLENIYEKAVESNIQPPSLIVIGDVVGLREKLRFHDNKPLFGKNIVITREKKAARETIEKFRDLGANVISFPTIRTQPVEDMSNLDKEIENLRSYTYIAFTSVNGVEVFFNRLFELGYDTRHLGDTKVVAIGPKTKKSLLKYGINADIMPEKYVAEELFETLKHILKAEDRILIPRAKIAREKLVEDLDKITNVKEVSIYETVQEDEDRRKIIEKLSNLDDYYLIFTSASTFNNFNSILANDAKTIIEKAKLASIGPITTQTVEKAGYKVDYEADEFTIEGIIEAIIKED